MSRGERSRPERTAEERQRDREERERKRAQRSGDGAGSPSSPESLPTLPSEAPDDPPMVEAPLHEPEPPSDLPGAQPPVDAFEPPEDLIEEPAVDEPPLEGLPLEPLAAEDSAASIEEHPLAAGEPPPAVPETPTALDPDEAVGGAPLTPDIELDEAVGGAPPTPDLERAPEPEPAPPTLSVPPPLPALPAPPRRPGAAEKQGGRAGVSLSRLAALVALVAVVVAVALLAHSLLGSKKERPVAAPVVVKVLIPEGKTRAQIAEVAEKAGLKGSYRAAAKSSGLLNPVHYGAPKDTPDLEGFLFPATYELDRGAPASQLVHEQLIAFQENFKSEYFRRAKALHVSAYGLLIVASMIEREAQVPSDRAKIAAVIYNRLADGMPLGIDASIYYAVEEEQHIATYTHELTESQLHIDSPYNTRTHTGLPPTPISNPGVASIKAAAHQAHVAYLYYVAAANGCGGQVFSDTLAQFETNAAAYEAAVKRNGGHPPSCKHH